MNNINDKEKSEKHGGRSWSCVYKRETIQYTSPGLMKILETLFAML